MSCCRVDVRSRPSPAPATDIPPTAGKRSSGDAVLCAVSFFTAIFLRDEDSGDGRRTAGCCRRSWSVDCGRAMEQFSVRPNAASRPVYPTPTSAREAYRSRWRWVSTVAIGHRYQQPRRAVDVTTIAQVRLLDRLSVPNLHPATAAQNLRRYRIDGELRDFTSSASEALAEKPLSASRPTESTNTPLHACNGFVALLIG